MYTESAMSCLIRTSDMTNKTTLRINALIGNTPNANKHDNIFDAWMHVDVTQS